MTSLEEIGMSSGRMIHNEEDIVEINSTVKKTGQTMLGDF